MSWWRYNSTLLLSPYSSAIKIYIKPFVWLPPEFAPAYQHFTLYSQNSCSISERKTYRLQATFGCLERKLRQLSEYVAPSKLVSFLGFLHLVQKLEKHLKNANQTLLCVSKYLLNWSTQVAQKRLSYRLLRWSK